MICAARQDAQTATYHRELLESRVYELSIRRAPLGMTNGKKDGEH